MLSLAKATILWNGSVKIYRYMICGVVATLPGDGPIGPKHVGANIRDILTARFNILCV